jgi:dTDP-glucose pyrophosphorylase
MKAGFNQFVFIIKPEFETAFKEIVDTTLPATISIEYVFQTMDSLLDGYTYLPERIKPRGT